MQALARGLQPALCHHADWLATMLHGQPGTTDWNSCLKAGWDPALEAYPPWLQAQVAPLTPELVRTASWQELAFASLSVLAAR